MQLILTVLVMLNIFVGMGASCSSNHGECSLRATYHSSTDTTYWTAACEDGSVFNGAIGGNETASLCLQ